MELPSRNVMFRLDKVHEASQACEGTNFEVDLRKLLIKMLEDALDDPRSSIEVMRELDAMSYSPPSTVIERLYES